MPNPSREGSDQFIIRFPAGMRDEVRRRAEFNRRSMNSEIVFILAGALKSRLEASYPSPTPSLTLRDASERFSEREREG